MTLKSFIKIAATLMILTSCGDTTGYGEMTPAEKLKVVQALMEKDDPRAAAVYKDIGIYLAYTVALFVM